MINAGNITVSIMLDTSSLTEGIQKGKESLKAFAESLESQAANPVHKLAREMGDKMIEAGKRMGEGLKQAVEVGEQLETKLDSLRNNTSMTAGEFKEVSEAVKQMGSQTSAPLSQLIDGVTHISNAGFNAKDSITILNQAMKASVVTGTDASKVSDLLATTMHQFHLKADQAGAAMNTLYLASKLGNVGLEQFKDVAGTTFGNAANLGAKLTDVSSAFAALTKNGMSATDASNQVQALLNDIVTPGDKAKETLKSLGDQAGVKLVEDFSRAGVQTKGVSGVLEDLVLASQRTKKPLGSILDELIPNLHSGNALIALTGGAFKDLKEISGQTGDAINGKLTPITDKYGESQKTLGTQLGILKNNMQFLGAEALEALAPALITVIDKLRGLFDWFRKLPQPAKDLTVQTVAFGGAALYAGGHAVNFANGLITLRNGFNAANLGSIPWIGKLGTMIKLLGTLAAAGAAAYAVVDFFSGLGKGIAGEITNKANAEMRGDGVADVSAFINRRAKLEAQLRKDPHNKVVQQQIEQNRQSQNKLLGMPAVHRRLAAEKSAQEVADRSARAAAKAVASDVGGRGGRGGTGGGRGGSDDAKANAQQRSAEIQEIDSEIYAYDHNDFQIKRRDAAQKKARESKIDAAQAQLHYDKEMAHIARLEAEAKQKAAQETKQKKEESDRKWLATMVELEEWEDKEASEEFAQAERESKFNFETGKISISKRLEDLQKRLGFLKKMSPEWMSVSKEIDSVKASIAKAISDASRAFSEVDHLISAGLNEMFAKSKQHESDVLDFKLRHGEISPEERLRPLQSRLDDLVKVGQGYSEEAIKLKEKIESINQGVTSKNESDRKKREDDAKKREDEAKQQRERYRQQVRDSFGSDLFHNLGDEAGSEFAQGLEKALGKNPIAKALRKSLERLFSRAMDGLANYLSEQLAAQGDILGKLFGGVGGRSSGSSGGPAPGGGGTNSTNDADIPANNPVPIMPTEGRSAPADGQALNPLGGFGAGGSMSMMLGGALGGALGAKVGGGMGGMLGGLVGMGAFSKGGLAGMFGKNGMFGGMGAAAPWLMGGMLALQFAPQIGKIFGGIGKSIKRLFHFDDPINDKMAVHWGLDFGNLFTQGVDTAIGRKRLMPAQAFGGGGVLGGGGVTVNLHGDHHYHNAMDARNVGRMVAREVELAQRVR